MCSSANTQSFRSRCLVRTSGSSSTGRQQRIAPQSQQGLILFEPFAFTARKYYRRVFHTVLPDIFWVGIDVDSLTPHNITISTSVPAGKAPVPAGTSIRQLQSARE
jgi:hypothetical protein